MMDGVRRAAGAAYGRPAARAATARGGATFSLPRAEAEETGAVAATGAAGGLLVLQAAAEDAARDAAARRRGRDILDELGALQRDLLAPGQGAAEGRLRRLAALAEGDAGADPGLREIVQALSLRARVQAELARPPR